MLFSNLIMRKYLSIEFHLILIFGGVFCFRAKDSDDGKRVIAKHQELIQLLDAFAKSIFAEWSKNVGQAANFNLKQHLLTRNEETQLISTNFDPQVKDLPHARRCIDRELFF